MKTTEIIKTIKRASPILKFTLKYLKGSLYDIRDRESRLVMENLLNVTRFYRGESQEKSIEDIDAEYDKEKAKIKAVVKYTEKSINQLKDLIAITKTKRR